MDGSGQQEEQAQGPQRLHRGDAVGSDNNSHHFEEEVDIGCPPWEAGLSVNGQKAQSIVIPDIWGCILARKFGLPYFECFLISKYC